MVFLRYIAAAIHRVEPLAPEVLDALSGPGGSTWSKGVPRVGSALAGLERPLVLVLDDLHAVASLSSLDVLAALVEYLPAGSQIAIASREAPELPLARWRAQGGVHEVGVADLRLDEREAGLLLQAAGVELEPDELSELTERTEGWPAGLYLAALSMQAGAPSSASAAALSGDDEFVSQYFRFELLSRLPPAESRFLQYTSVLDRMCGGLCDAVLQTTRSVHTLETLARTNGFVVPLDRRGQWYRYHHLFGELLRTELERSEPHVVSALNRRAMDWCIANDLMEAAVVYGHAAGETDTVAGLVDALTLELYNDGRRETVEEWLGWFSDEELARYPALAVLGAWFRALTGRPAEAERWLALADGATSALPLSDGSATIEPWVATLRAHMMPDGVERALADADRALSLLSPRATGGRPRSWPGVSRTRCSARPIVRRTTSRQPSRRGWRPAPPKRPTWHTHNSRCSPPTGEPGARQGDTRGRHRTSSSRRAWATTGRARSRSRRRRASPSTRDNTSRPARHWPAPTVCGRCSTTAFPGRRSKSGSSSHAPISRSPTPAPPARYSPRPSRCSSCVPTWAHSSRRHANCTNAWQPPKGPAAPGR